MERAFDVIPFEDIQGDWKKLGSGSFGNVYKGVYLGIDVAIKEVLPSKDYDVAKYFEREWRLMKEARHPNVVLYLGLSRAPPPDNRIFIISEFIENGNLRTYIHSKSQPLPWRLRLSFATDIARALAYLHARACIHRDLKGENLLLTGNGRLKITDFGFARIAARNADELRRLTFCGTDAYMSPEILRGDTFGLPTDIFSLGVIFAEIASRTLADDDNFKRTPPDFLVAPSDVHRLASPGCPPAFMQLTLDCLKDDPASRPTTVEILARLREIELEVLARPSEAEDGDAHIGSVKFLTGGRRPGPAPRIPSFGMGVGKDIRGNSEDDDSDEEELKEALRGLDIDGEPLLPLLAFFHYHWHEDARTDANEKCAEKPLLDPNSSNNGSGSNMSEYSTTVIRSHSPQTPNAVPPSLSSILTIRSPRIEDATTFVHDPTSLNVTASNVTSSASTSDSNSNSNVATASNVTTTKSIASIDSFHTATSSVSVSTAAATEGGSTIRSPSNVPSRLAHRFTLIKPGRSFAKRAAVSGVSHNHSNNHSPPRASPGSHPHPHSNSNSNNHAHQIQAQADPGGADLAWSPFDFFFSSGLVTKCDLCTKRLGWKPVLECDDCGLRAHARCGEMAPMDCGVRPARARFAMSR
ncbi:kinase-like protein [Rickenella mellea]|uniref:Kinase-like protein n=1 Tax=Rickenella mellea TaxID=50990 RepID=A0A4Y7QJ37_9AGAM|nr:kinase-like protein [Rickenella mellea]